jgi:hypothetical protein
MAFALKTNKTSMDSERKVFHSLNTNNASTLIPSFRQNKKVLVKNDIFIDKENIYQSSLFVTLVQKKRTTIPLPKIKLSTSGLNTNRPFNLPLKMKLRRSISELSLSAKSCESYQLSEDTINSPLFKSTPTSNSSDSFGQLIFPNKLSINLKKEIIYEEEIDEEQNKIKLKNNVNKIVSNEKIKVSTPIQLRFRKRIRDFFNDNNNHKTKI